MNSPAIGRHPPLAACVALLKGSGLPAGLAGLDLQHFFFAGSQQAPLGIIGLELYGSDALLRSLVVDPARRASGVGSALLAHAETHARAHGIRALYLLTTTAEPFFSLRGYVRASRDTAPASIRATGEFSHLCPASSAFMVKHLVPEELK